MKSVSQTAIFLAGIAQLALAAGSLLIPGILKWKEELSKVKQILWPLAGIDAGY